LIVFALEKRPLGFDRKFDRRARDEPVEFLKRISQCESAWTETTIAAFFSQMLPDAYHHASWQDYQSHDGHRGLENRFYS
jgi:hypothetical protein